MAKTYCISKPYRARSQYSLYDGLAFEDESQFQWQLEVYLHALGLMKKYGLKSVLDVGCGSAYKLVTYLGEYETIGLELPDNVHALRERYPDREWRPSDFSVRQGVSADVVICADVVEHLADPDELMSFLQGISFSYLVMSTPDRNLVYWPWQRGYWGPPGNIAHQREWTFREFEDYVSGYFDVIDHRVTNLAQSTQMTVCRLRVS